MKHSHLLRAGCRRPEEFESAALPLQGGAADRVRVVQLTSPVEGGALLDALKSDYLELLDRFAPLNRTFQTQWDTELIDKVRLSHELDLNAAVRLGARAPEIRLNFGLCLAVEDAILDLMCVRGVFVQRRSKEDQPPSFGVLSIGHPSASRYHEYADINGARGDRLGRLLTRALPLDKVRLAQADILLFYALRWVWFHEQAHWLLGHLGYLEAQDRAGINGLEEDTLFTLADSAGEGASEAFCMELQADALATQCLVAETLGLDAEEEDRSMQAYRQVLVGDTQGPARFAPDPDMRSTRFRICLLASGLCAILFELRRERRGQISATHPPPSSRLINIALSGLSTYGDIAQFEAGDGSVHDVTYKVDLLRPACNDLMTVLFELEILAGMIRLEQPFYRCTALQTQPGQLGPGEASPIARDIFSLIFKTQGADLTFATEGGQVFNSHLAQSHQLYESLKSHARVSGFR